jgi:hypothetical protein
MEDERRETTGQQGPEMPEGKKRSRDSEDAEEVKEILTVVSEKVPALIKGLMSSVFSPDAAKDMGRAAATYYSELKAGGIPESVAVQMTKEYIGTFSKISDFIKTASGGRGQSEQFDFGSDLSRDIQIAVKKKLKRRLDETLGEDEKD